MEKIRFARLSDRKQLEDLVMVMIGDENPYEVAKLVVNDFYKNEDVKVFIIENLQEVRGFGVLKFNAFEGANEVAELVWLGIEKKYKRQGLGRKLTNYIEQYAKEKNIRKIYLKTSSNNKVAVCFWIMQNYKFEARMLDFSLKHMDDYYLSKEIY